ncbi:MAG: peptidylprolyl isomerase [Bacteroidetes bacterium]|nr:MAG: peptidylprolyl isomerase [Bacteroidota bacterium]
MAILNKIRQRSLFLILVIALALFSFVLADLFKNSSGFSSSSQNIVATINGKDVKREEFMNKVESAQRQYGNSMTSTQAMNTVWDQEVRNAVFDVQFDELGLTVERDYIRSLLEQSLSDFEEFKNDAGIFDENKLNEFIANLKAIQPETTLLNGSPINYQAWTNFEANISATGKEQMYMNMVKAGVIGTLADGELDYKLENDNVDVRFIQIPFSSIPDSTITVSQSDIKAYVNKNKDKFEVEESRDLYFVQFTEEPSLEDEEAVKNEVASLINGKADNSTTESIDETVVGFKDTNDEATFLAEHSATKLYDGYVFKEILPTTIADSINNMGVGDVYGPYKEGNLYKATKLIDVIQVADSAKVRHILIPFAGATRVDAAVTKTDAEAKKTADSIYNVLRANRSKFKSLLELSSDKVSNEKDGEIEFAYTDSFAPEFRDYSFNNKVGDFAVVKTSFGYHIIEILKQGDRKKAFKVGHLSLPIEASEKTVDEVYTKTSKFEIAVTNGVFQDVAKESGYVVKPVSNIKVLDETIPGLGAQRAMVRWAFENGIKVGSVKRFNLQTGGYAVAVVSGINKKGLMTTEKASVTALPAIRKEKKAALIKERISGNTLEEVSSSEGQQIRTAAAVNMKNPTLSGAGREPYVIGAAFGLKESETSKVLTGNLGMYMIQVTKITNAAELPSYQAAANRVGTAKSSSVNTALYNALRDAAKIEDNRATFY